jgi:outer membrane protein
MRRYRFHCMLLVLAACNGDAIASDSRQYYLSALGDDPVFAQARDQTLQMDEAVAQAGAALLPDVALRSARERLKNGQWVTSSELRITQPLLDRKATAALAAARSRARAAAADEEAARQDLLLRAASAWTTIGVRDQEHQFAIANRDALAFQAARSQARFEIGLAPGIDAVETSAQHASAVAWVLDAEVALDDAREAVTQIARSWSAPEQEDTWMHRSWPSTTQRVVSVHEPLAVTAARHRLDAASHARRGAQAARWPTMALQLRYGRSSVGTAERAAPTPFRRRPSLILGLQVTMPLMGSAIASANVRRANAQWDAAASELQIATRNATRSIRRLELAERANEPIVRARQSAEAASRASVEATKAGLDTGTRTTVDVLLAQRRLLDARRTTANATATRFLDQLSLLAARGILEVTDLERPPNRVGP